MLILLLSIALSRQFTIEDMLSFRRLSLETVTGTTAYFSLSIWDNITDTSSYPIRKVDISSTDSEGEDFLDVDGVSFSNFVYISSSERMYCLSSESGSSQVWYFNPSDPTQRTQLTDFPIDVESFKISEGEDLIVFSASVYPGKTLQETADRDEEIANQGYQATVHERLMVRRWDAYWTGKYKHIFVADLTSSTDSVTIGDPTDILSDGIFDCPSRPFGGAEEYDISKDGTLIAFATVEEDVAFSLNSEIYIATVGSTVSDRSTWVCVSDGNIGYDSYPAFSPDGKSLAYLSMDEPNDESDRGVFMVYSLSEKTITNVTGSLDYSFSTPVWSSDSVYLYSTVPDNATNRVVRVKVEEQTQTIEFMTTGNTVHGFALADDGTLVFSKSSYQHPAEIFVAVSETEETRVTAVNEDKLDGIEFGAYESMLFDGDLGDKVQAYILYPVGYDESKTYPMVYYIHGGPESPWQDEFHYRWNPELITAQGYIVVAPNPHGSGGFGDAYLKAIRGSWGGVPYNDLMDVLDQLPSKVKSADVNNTCAMGASYGGFMMNWLNGHTNNFKCIICHDGAYDVEGGYYYMDEMYFLETEFVGTMYDSPDYFVEYNPMNSASNAKTPQMTIHGGTDYRLDDVNGYMAFFNLQTNGVESKYVRYPEENHWVLNPHNSINWHQNVFDWLEKHLTN